MLLCKSFYNYFVGTMNLKKDSSLPGSKSSLKRCYTLMTKSVLLWVQIVKTTTPMLHVNPKFYMFAWQAETVP